jgi:putative transposase
MPRIARVVVEDIPQHVIQRGNRNQPVFFSDEDKQAYLGLLKAQLDIHQVSIWAWCLMDTHVHFVAVPSRKETFSRAFAETHRLYSRRINFREGWRGYLFQGRFSSFPMDESYLYAAMRYVENNPVKASIVRRAEDYPWSSARAHVLGTPDPILSPCFLEEAIEDWGLFLREGPETETRLLDTHAKTGRPLGSNHFVERLETLLNRQLKKQKPGPKKAGVLKQN